MSNFDINIAIKKSFGLNKMFKKLFIRDIGLNKRKFYNILLKELHVKYYYSFKKFFCVGKELKRYIKENINFLKSNKNFRGIRHLMNLPTRGQRTHTNAKTKKAIKN